MNNSARIISFLREILSKEIKKDMDLSIGLIYISIKEDFPDKPLIEMKLNDFKYVFQNGLKKRLKRIKINNYDEIVNRMIKTSTDNQSLLTLANI